MTGARVFATRHPNPLRAVLGYLPQDFGVYPHLNALEFLHYLAALKGLDQRTASRRIDELLQVVNLMVGLWLGCAAAPTPATRTLGLLLAALWPLLIWSQLGCRDTRYQTEALLGHAPFPVARTLGAAWAAGVLLTAVVLSGVVMGRLIWSEPLALLPWTLAVLFIPTLALILGVWSRGSKLFEVLYLVLWYLGPFNTGSQLAALDYLGIHAEAPVHTAPLGVSSTIILLLLLGVVGRRRQ